LDERCGIIEQKHRELDLGDKYLKEKVGDNWQRLRAGKSGTCR